jgi:DNA uptake protein ComE-like DNA-binding protein
MRHLRSAIAAALFAALSVPASVGAQVGKPVTIKSANIATEAELAAVPGITAALAKELLAKRPFLRQSDFDAALAGSLTAEQRSEAYRLVFVPIDLNDVTDAEIRMIPGVGDRMLHEFREYAPYRALAQFHREIDKYVDDEELARLEQYVYVRVSLNSASDEDILSIPGVGSRMLHEFKEYRPYRAMAEWDREIGKYVDASELSRLRRYVEVR